MKYAALSDVKGTGRERGKECFPREAATYPKTKGLQHVPQDRGRQQNHSALGAVRVPVHVDALALQEFQVSFLW